MARKNWKKAHRIGKIGELIALIYLLFKGYLPCARNIQTPFAEIDLICRRGDLIILVEVKTRITIKEAMESLRPAQIDRLHSGFSWWLGQHNRMKAYQRVRMDMIAIGFNHWPHHIKAIMPQNNKGGYLP